MSVLSQWKNATVALALAASLMVAPVHAKIEPVQTVYLGQADIAAQATPRPADQAPGPSRDDAVLGRGDAGLSWIVMIAVVLGAIAIAVWWWPKFQRSRTGNTPPITPSRGPAPNKHEPNDREH